MVERLLEVIGANIRKRLKALRLEDGEAAKAAGMPSSQFSNLKNGKSGRQGPTLYVLSRLAKALKTTPAALLDDGTEAPACPPARHEDYPIGECWVRIGQGLDLIGPGGGSYDAVLERIRRNAGEPGAPGGVPAGSGDEAVKGSARTEKPRPR